MATHEMRLVVTASDFDEALHFYRDSLGLTQRAAFASEDGRAVILEAGRASIELADPSHASHVDEIEVGRRIAGHIRVAFQVDEAARMTAELTGAGARLLAPPTETPWNSLNSRLEGPAGLQLTLFEELGSKQAEPA
jgi:lactoylglutathione lyase